MMKKQKVESSPRSPTPSSAESSSSSSSSTSSDDSSWENNHKNNNEGNYDSDSSDVPLAIDNIPKTKQERIVPEIHNDLKIEIPQDATLQSLGKVCKIIKSVLFEISTVLIEANPDSSIVDLSTLIVDVFGKTDQPFYTLRFPKESDLDKLTVTVGTELFYVPQMSAFITVQTLYTKGCDASNMFDEEIQSDERKDFSDDEAELLFKQKKEKQEGKKKKKQNPSSNGGPHPKNPNSTQPPGPILSNPRNFPQSQTHYPSSNQPYPSSNQPYHPPLKQSYHPPSQRSYHPSSNQPYTPSNQSHHPSSNQSYTSSNQSYHPPSNQPYTSSNQSYTPSNQVQTSSNNGMGTTYSYPPNHFYPQTQNYFPSNLLSNSSSSLPSFPGLQGHPHPPIYSPHYNPNAPGLLPLFSAGPFPQFPRNQDLSTPSLPSTNIYQNSQLYNTYSNGNAFSNSSQEPSPYYSGPYFYPNNQHSEQKSPSK